MKQENENKDKIVMITDSGESVDFYVLEETRINASGYLLVTDAPEGEDGECYILKDVSGQQDAEAIWRTKMSWTVYFAYSNSCWRMRT